MTAAIVETESIFSCECDEPGGIVNRHVYPMALNPTNLTRFWDLASRFKTLFGDEINGDFKKFAEMLISMDSDENIYANGLFWKIDDFVGIFYLTHINTYDARIHYSFFDRRHHGRQQLVRKMIKWGFNKYGFRRLSAEIPYFAKGTFGFVQDVGLQVEGRKRKAVLMDKEWFDVKCFGVLREEAESWE